MLLEDVLLLMPGQTVTLLISKSHSILTSSIARAKRLRELFKKTIQFNPLQPVQFGKNQIFSIATHGSFECALHWCKVEFIPHYHFGWIFITIIELTNSLWLSLSLPSFNPLILVDYPSSQDGKNLSIDDCKRSFVKQGGNGITFEFQFGPDIKSNVDTACIFFSNLVEHPFDMMFWISNRLSGGRMTMLKKASS